MFSVTILIRISENWDALFAFRFKISFFYLFFVNFDKTKAIFIFTFGSNGNDAWMFSVYFKIAFKFGFFYAVYIGFII